MKSKTDKAKIRELKRLYRGASANADHWLREYNNLCDELAKLIKAIRTF
jgi:hypothetical protein